MNSMNMKLVKVNGKTREDLLVALANLGGIDADFNGENGIEYLWDKVWKANGFESMEDYEEKNEYDSDEDDDYEEIELKYESNMAYLLDILKDKETDKELIEEYVSDWIGCENYYKYHILDVVYDENGKAECIALATMY